MSLRDNKIREVLKKVSNYRAISLSAQTRDTALWKRKRRADSDLRRSDYEKVKEGVVVVPKWEL
jgi:hypothetical protein